MSKKIGSIQYILSEKDKIVFSLILMVLFVSVFMVILFFRILDDYEKYNLYLKYKNSYVMGWVSKVERKPSSPYSLNYEIKAISKNNEQILINTYVYVKKNYNVGDSILVYYDPENPQTNSFPNIPELTEELVLNDIKFFSIMACIFFVLIFILFIKTK